METYYYRKGYRPNLSLKDNEYAIKVIRNYFETRLASELKLLRVTAPLFVESRTGINDDLSGKEVPVTFNVSDFLNHMEIVHSLAKWKRLNISKFNLKTYEGIYTDMNAIRKDEVRDNYHSIYVDQWDYEILITEKDRNLNFLKKVVNKIYDVLYETEKFSSKNFKCEAVLPKNIKFITSEKLLKKYPNLSPDERVNEYVKEKGAIFVAQIGAPLSNGLPQDSRAPDYDDWELNGDLFVYNPVLGNALELSSMGIRVNKESLVKQCELSNKNYMLNFKYQQKVLHDELPYTIGGGIGQSRLCMFMLKKLHIGEVQSSIWSLSTIEGLKDKGVTLL